MVPVYEDEELQRALAEALQELEILLESRPSLTRATSSVDLVRSARSILMAAASSLGECQQDVPYAKLRPVLRADGTLTWCCSHKTQHCKS